MLHEVKIADELIQEARKITGNKTDKGAIEKAVREYLRMEQIRRQVQSLKGSVSFK